MPPLPGFAVIEQISAYQQILTERAVRLRDGRPVILRRLLGPNITYNQISRFAYSQALLTKFDHPNIIQCLDWIETDNSPDKSPVMVLEDINAICLSQYLNQQALSLEQFFAISTQLCEIVRTIHQERIIHKDLHPENILIEPKSGRIQLFDFHLATQLSHEHPCIATPKQLEGHLDYLSPEQTGLLNRKLDHRCDLYSLGIFFFELLSGHPPFFEGDPLTIIHAHVAHHPPSLTTLRSGLPSALTHIVEKLLSKDAEDRYQHATGLQHDLRKTHDNWLNSNNSHFPLGEADLSDDLQISQKLYGREQALQTLMQHFHQANLKRPQCLAVAGYSGVGKSSLINEMHKPVAAQNGLFISGKFEQYIQNSPYYAIRQAFKAWLNHIACLPEDSIQIMQKQVARSLGSRASVLVEWVPEMSRFLGLQPRLPGLLPLETQDRLHQTLKDFLACISAAHPLVIFLDDLQWADYGTLNLLQALMNEPVGRFMLLLSYRNNELGHGHPAVNTLKKIPGLHTLKLEPLTTTDLEHLLADTLFQKPQTVQPLARRVKQKTDGNPFFVNIFLRQLHENGILNFDPSRRTWHWQLESIEGCPVTDNVLDLLSQQIRHLPSHCQQLLHMAACLGSRFDLDRLAMVSDLSITDCAYHLWPALDKELIVQDGGDWFLGVASAINLAHFPLRQEHNPQPPRCRFVHDRVLQAAYLEQSETQRAAHHLTIGRRLLGAMPKEQWDTCIFTLVKHLNLGKAHINTEKERLQLVMLNDKAALKAKQSGAWMEAERYAQEGRKLLPENAWHTHHDLCFNLHRVSAECAVLSGALGEAEQIYKQLMAQAQDNLVKAQLCLDRVKFYFAQGQWEKTLDVGKQGLSYCCLRLPDNASDMKNSLIEAEQQLEHHLTKTAIKQIAQLPELDNALIQTAMGILTNMGQCSSISGDLHSYRLFVLMALNLSYQYGRCDLTALCLATYGYLHIQSGHYQKGVEAAEQALMLVDAYPRCQEAANTLNTIAITALHFQWPPSRVLQILERGYQQGLQQGEAMRATITLHNQSCIHLLIGTPLPQVQQQAHEAVRFAVAKKVFMPVGQIVEQLSRSLCHARYLLDTQYFERHFLQLIETTIHKTYLEIARLFFSFWSGWPIDEQLLAIETESSSQTKPYGFPILPDYWLVSGLTVIRAFAEQPGYRSRTDYQNALQQAKEELEKLAAFCPNNFAHKHLLLQAELHRLGPEEHSWKALPLYELAIQSAKSNDYPHYLALTNELCSEFWQRKQRNDVALVYAREALTGYHHWGCKSRIDRMRQTFWKLNQACPEIGRIPETAQPDSAEQSPARQMIYPVVTNRQTLDLASIMKSCRAISQEVQMDVLVMKVLEVIIENAGAQIGALILNRPQKGATIEAYYNILSGERTCLQAIPLEKSPILPDFFIYEALSKGESCFLSLKEALNQFPESSSSNRSHSKENYLYTMQPQSMLCMPILHRDQIVGALYLEHRELPQVFSEDQLDLITLLLAQAAISLENARLFTDLQNLNQALETKVQKRTAALQSAIDELQYLATRDSLTGLFNRRHFMECCERELQAARTSLAPLALLIIDIDHFKQVNDNYGHPAGDEVLIAVSHHCQSRLDAKQILGRLGGEEFGVCLPRTDQKHARSWAQSLLESIRSLLVKTPKGNIGITLSIGLYAMNFPNQQSLGEGLQKADEALYQAKEQGRNQVRLA